MSKMLLFAGNCILEDMETSMKTAEFLAGMAQKHGFDLVYKSSFKKDNRSSADFYTGPGLEKSAAIFRAIKEKLGLKIVTDFHHIYELDTELAQIADVLQIPAYLCMQTELVLKMASTGKPVNIKKGQFLHPEDVKHVIGKIESTGNRSISITERGTCFGYRDLVVDPRSFHIMKGFGYPVLFDAGHSVRKYGVPSADLERGGQKEFTYTLARAAAACRIDGLFVEVHPDPPSAKCDAATQLSFPELERLIAEVLPVWQAVQTLPAEMKQREQMP